MSCYISSNENRLYVAAEANYGEVPVIQSVNRIPAVKLQVRQRLDRAERKDKTGSRTYFGAPAGVRKETTFELRTYMTGWADLTLEQGYGPLFSAALGAAPQFFAGGVVSLATDQMLAFTAPHGLSAGQAVTFGGELRFVSAIVDALTVELNAPFTLAPGTGSPIGATVSYRPATDLPSVSVFDYWGPAAAVQRILAGAAVDRLVVHVNADYHEFEFRGGAQDVIDSASFTAGQGALAAFPAEPALGDFDYSIIPGHLGQAWLGSTPDRFYTVTGAEIALENDLDLRNREFGRDGPSCVAAGQRSVSMDLDLFEQATDATKALYQAARQRSPAPMMFQLGQQPGQLFGIYMGSVVPEVPEFDDGEPRLEWHFAGCRAQGTVDDEVYVAFG